MTADPNNLNCQQFQAQMADLIGSGADAASHPHLQGCPRCRALLADLETIAEAARQLLAGDQPQEDLWTRIESAIKKEGSSPSRD
jgi:hypothetical protein